MSIGDYVIAALLLATFGVMVAGVALMGAGGASNQKYSNKLMTMRVSLQGLVLLVIAVVFLAEK